MGPSIKPYYKKKNWRDKKKYLRTLKASVTKADTKQEEVDDSNTVFSYSIFTVADASDQVQLHSTSAKLAIPQDPNIKGIIYAASYQMQVSETTTTSETDTVTIVIPKSQVAIMVKEGDNLVDQLKNHIQ